MPLNADKPLDLPPPIKAKYVISSQHRRVGNPNKTIWLITHREELDCFILSHSSDWKCEKNHGWGLKKTGKSLDVVGTNNDKEELKLCKFIDGDKKDIWHGYPADYKRRNQDIPAMTVLLKWCLAGHIEKHQMVKIRQGRSCNL